MRVEYPGAIYHVMDRGDRREDIFVNDVDRQGGPVSFSFGTFAQWTTAKSVHDLKGLSLQAGASVGVPFIGAGLSGGFDFAGGVGLHSDKFNYKGIQANIAGSLGLLFELHAVVTLAAGWDTDGGWGPAGP